MIVAESRPFVALFPLTSVSRLQATTMSASRTESALKLESRWLEISFRMFLPVLDSAQLPSGNIAINNITTREQRLENTIRETIARQFYYSGIRNVERSSSKGSYGRDISFRGEHTPDDVTVDCKKSIRKLPRVTN